MIRRSTIILLLVLVMASLGLYRLKYSVQGLEIAFADLERQVAEEQEAIHVLDAEWAHLNQPERLSVLVARYLQWSAIEANQFVAIDGLPLRDTRDGQVDQVLTLSPKQPDVAATNDGDMFAKVGGRQ